MWWSMFKTLFIQCCVTYKQCIEVNYNLKIFFQPILQLKSESFLQLEIVNSGFKSPALWNLSFHASGPLLIVSLIISVFS